MIRRNAIAASGFMLVLFVTLVITTLGSSLPAYSATSTTGQSTISLTGGTLSIGTVTNQTISGTIGSTLTGSLPSAAWSDNTGSGSGWNGTIAVSDFTYTGQWSQTSGTTQALGSTNGGSYTGTNDGVYYTVTVASGGTSSSTPYSYTSNDSGASGTGSATNGSSTSLGLNGINITFASGTTYGSGDTYTVHAGTQSTTTLALDATVGSITAASGTSSPAPAFANSGTVVGGGGTGVTSYGTAVKFVSAAVNTGMGTYTIVPGASLSVDGSSWAASYLGGVQYTIASGP